MESAISEDSMSFASDDDDNDCCGQPDVLFDFGGWLPVETRENTFDENDTIGSNGSQAGDIPETSAGNQPLETYEPNGETFVTGAHALMNGAATLLARKGHRINFSKRQRHYIERMVSTTTGKSVPLLYPEAALFPSCFYLDDEGCGSTLGAIPAGLMTDTKHLQRHGFAPLTDQLRSRMKNHTLLCSSDPRYINYAFDCLMNLAVRDMDIRILLHRGIAGVGINKGVKLSHDFAPRFQTDAIDSSATLNKLAACSKAAPGSFFYTMTCNQLGFMGTNLIKEWINSDEALRLICNEGDSEAMKNEKRKALVEASSPIMLRVWTEVATLWMDYICNSNEQPLGKIAKVWWRFEFQDAQGNLPHIHAILWVEREHGETDEEHTKKLCRYVSGHLKGLLDDEQLAFLVASGLFDTEDAALQALLEGSKVLKHECSARCMKRVSADGTLSCRVVNNGVENPHPGEHTVKTIEVEHSKAAEDILVDLGLFVMNEQGCCVPNKDCEFGNLFVAQQHYPPAGRDEGPVSACNGMLFLATMCAQNLKLICGTYFLNRYLTKYVSKIDEHNRVFINTRPGMGNAVNADGQMLHNTKITTSAYNEKKMMDSRRDSSNPTARAISRMEMLMVIFGYPQVYTTWETEKISTSPLETRPAVEAMPRVKGLIDEGVARQNSTLPSDLDVGFVFPSYAVRERLRGMPTWRKHGAMEQLTYTDRCFSGENVDSVTVFSLRPPELRWCREQANYARWFYRSKTKIGKNRGSRASQRQSVSAYLAKAVLLDFNKTQWVDSTDHKVYVRRKAVPEILKYLNERTAMEDCYADDMLADLGPERLRRKLSREGAVGMVQNLFRILDDVIEGRRRIDGSSHYVSTFFGDDSRQHGDLPVVWHNNVSPRHTHRWIIHILLSMGKMSCEASVFLGATSIRECFVRAKLFNPRNDPAEEAKKLTKKYIVEQLAFTPGGTKTFDRCIVQAYRNLHELLVHDRVAGNDDVPPFLFTRLRDSLSDKAEKRLAEKKEKLLDALLMSVGSKAAFKDIIPDRDAILAATPSNPVTWDIEIKGVENQAEESVAMQRNAIGLAEQTLTNYMSCPSHQHRNVVIVGSPGAGKTTMMELVILKALSHGLNGAVTALLGDRASTFNCEHIYEMFKIPVNTRAPPARLVDLALIALGRDPVRLNSILRMDFLAFDEFGQVSAELLSILDMILRKARGSSLYMGGVLVFATMDKDQLLPVSGRPPLLSSNMVTSFTFVRLQRSVRAAGDALFQELQDITRLSCKEIEEAPDIRQRFIQLVKTVFTHVVSFDDPRIKPTMLRVFGKRSANRKEETRLISQMRAVHRPRGEFLTATAEDLETTADGSWVGASAVTSHKLNRAVKEPMELAFFPLAVYEVTFNVSGKHSQSQLAVLREMPTEDQLKDHLPVKLLLAPNGVKCLPENPTSLDSFRTAGWYPVSVGPVPDRLHVIGHSGLQAKRKQYGLRHRIAATIHVSMGQDLNGLVTRVSLSEKEYQLWDKRQVVVLVSRTYEGHQTIFVGNPDETAAALCRLLTKSSQFDRYMAHLMDTLCGSAVGSTAAFTVVDLVSYHTYRPVDIDLPVGEHGYVYLIVSTRDTKCTYIGETENLRKRLRKHNNGTATEQTASNHLRPWGLLAFVVGFDSGSRQNRRTFEGAWKARRDTTAQQRPGGVLSPDEILQVGRDLLESPTWSALPLRLVIAGTTEPVARTSVPRQAHENINITTM